jgi:hypothetical protein
MLLNQLKILFLKILNANRLGLNKSHVGKSLIEMQPILEKLVCVFCIYFASKY